MDYEARDRTKIVRAIRRRSYGMTAAERAAVMQAITAAGLKPRDFIVHRFDRGYRRVYGYGDKYPRPIAFTWRNVGKIMEQNGQVWFDPAAISNHAETLKKLVE